MKLIMTFPIAVALVAPVAAAVAQDEAVVETAAQVTIPPPAPPPTIAVARSVRNVAEKVIPFEIRVIKSGKEIWRGSLSVGGLGSQGATFSQDKREAMELCEPGNELQRTPYGNNERLNLRLSSARQTATPSDTFSLNITVVQPGDVCDGGGNTTIGIQRNVEVAKGASARVDAEAGLIVILTRKD